jgi:YVTN family beta-propeller protein
MKRYLLVLLAAVSLCPQVLGQTIVDTIPVGHAPTAVAVNTKNNRVYVTNGSDLTVDVIDGSTDAIIATMPTTNSPTDVAVNAVKNEIWVCESDNGGNIFVEVFDGSTNTLIKNIPITGSGIGRVAVQPHLNRIFVADDSSTSVSVVDGKNKVFLTNITVPCLPFGIAANSITNLVYAGTRGCAGGSVYVIDATTNTVVNTITTTGVSMNYASFDQNHNRVYMTDDVKGIYVIDANTNTVTGVLGNIKVAHGVAAVPGTQMAVAASEGGGSIKVVNGSIPAVVGRVRVGNKPVAVAVNSVTRRIYVVNQSDNTVTVMSY